MRMKLTCHPPLGQNTIIPEDQDAVIFTVCARVGGTSRTELTVSLWHNAEDVSSWKALDLSEITNTDRMLVASNTHQNDIHLRWFSVALKLSASNPMQISFTIRFRCGKADTWKWANESFSQNDGTLYIRKTLCTDLKLTDFFENGDPSLVMTKEASQTPHTSLWSVRGSVRRASGKKSGCTSLRLGRPFDYTRWFALVRLWTPWLAPRHGKSVFHSDRDAIMSAFLRHDGQHVVILAVSGIGNILTVLTSGNDGSVMIDARNDAENEGTCIVLVAVGSSFEVANAAVMYHARKLVTQYYESESEIASIMEQNSGVDAKWYEQWYSGLTYCTWNGLGQRLTADRIYHALDVLQNNNIKITGLIIDDNWQSLDHPEEGQFKRSWLEFEANKEGFPDGLKNTVSAIRHRHSNIKHVAVWHALMGYWGGISPEGKIAREYRTAIVECQKPGFTAEDLLTVAKEDIPRLYRDFYSFLASCGIDSVKTDAQFYLDELVEAEDRRNLIPVYQHAWTVNHLRYFAARAISCMSQIPQILFHTQLPTNLPRLLVRNSDDFFPNVLESHPWHIFCNAHNALLTQYLNVLPDWDMFQTSHPWARFHAAARCVSGGPIYITDVPGEHDIDLIRQMTAQTCRGDTVILRPSVVGKTTQAYVAYDELALLKVGSFNGMQRTGTGILGVFNTTQSHLTDLISLSDIPGTEYGTYVIRAFNYGGVSAPVKRQDTFALVYLDLPVKGWEILTAYPVQQMQLKRKHQGKSSTGVDVAILGLLDKMTGSVAIETTQIYVEESGRLRIWAATKALGIYGLYISDLENRSLEDDFLILLFGKVVSLDTVTKSRTKNVLEVNLTRAWAESDQKASWSNEVVVEVFVH